MRRIAVIGSSGVGKSTVAGTVADRLDVALIELDALMHGPGWTPTPTPEFRRRLLAEIATADAENDGWVIPGNSRNVTDIVHGGADTIVWLDLARRTSMWRLFRRSVRRSIRREETWGGNRETLRRLVSRDQEANVLLWAWRHHPQYTEIYEGYQSGTFWAHATVHRLRTSGEVARFLDRLSD